MKRLYLTKEKKIVVTLSIILAIFNAIINNNLAQILSFWIFLMIVIIVMKFDFLHPYVWYFGMQTVYYTAYPILYELGFNTTVPITSEPLFIVSLMTLVLSILIPGKHENNTLENTLKVDSPANKFFIHLFTIIAILTVLLIKINGFQTKNQMYYSEFGFFYRTVFFLALIYINVFIFYECSILHNKGKIDFRLIVEVGLSTLLLTLFSGERDIFIRFLVVVILILKFFGKLKNRTFITLLLGFVILIPLSTTVKYYFLSGSTIDMSFTGGWKTLLNNFLSGEFVSASRNLQILVNNENTVKGLFLGKTYFSDVIRVLGFAPFSAIHWYQETFFPNDIVGKGFTIIGEGYINFGYIGVFFSGIIIGGMLRYFYKNHTKNIYYLYIYICSIPLFIYANRADLANIFAPLVRQVFLSLLIIFIIDKLTIYKKTKT